MSEERDDLRSMIAESLAADTKDNAEDGAETSPGPADKQSPRQGDLPLEPKDAPSEGSAEAPRGTRPAAAVSDQPADQPDDQPATAAAPAAAPSAPGAIPEHWAEADRRAIEALPAEARGTFLALYKRMEAGLTPKLQRGAQLERDYGVLDQIFTPEQRQLLSRQGREPKDIIGIWHGVELGLQNRQTQAEVIARIIHGYNANLSEVGGWLNRLQGFAQPAGYANQPAPPAPLPGNNGQAGNGQVDAEMARRLQALESEAQARNYATAADIVAKFANATDSSGNLLHPHFAQVEPLMQRYAAIARSSGEHWDMEDLYNRAIWSDPATREKVLAERSSAEAARSDAERKARAEQARRAGSSISGAPSPGQLPADGGGNPDRSIRDEIRAQMPRRMP